MQNPHMQTKILHEVPDPQIGPVLPLTFMLRPVEATLLCTLVQVLSAGVLSICR